MLKDTDISFFHYSCDDTRSDDIAHYLENLNGLIYLGENCYTVEDKKILPEYIKRISSSITDIEFIHTYAFTLSNNTGYSIFKGGQVLYQHIEGLAERLTELTLSAITLTQEKMIIEFIHHYYQCSLDFDSKPESIKIYSEISSKHFDFLKDRDFSEKIKQYLIFNTDTDLLLQEKAHKIIKQKDLMIYLYHLELEKKIPEKFEKEDIQKI